MANEAIKGDIEISVFEEFIRAAGLISTDPPVKCKPPEPDLRVKIGGEAVAFELVELCDSNLARAFSDPRPNQDGVELIRTADPSASILTKKLRRKYETSLPIELLCYSAGRIITPVDVIIPTIKPIISSFRHTFRRAWLLAAGRAYVLWTNT